jgi:hypothetical protein
MHDKKWIESGIQITRMTCTFSSKIRVPFLFSFEPQLISLPATVADALMR